MTIPIINEAQHKRVCANVVETARGILAGSIGIVASAGRLA
jgi:hypothetical protein